MAKEDKNKKDKKDIQPSFHWAFTAANITMQIHGDQPLYTCESGVTPSGTIHIGNFREIITIELIKRAFKILGKNVRHLHSWDDYDVFRKVPKNMPNQEKLKDFLRKPITNTPDTYDCNHSSFAEHNKSKVVEVLPKVGINPTYVSQTEKYKNCDYAKEVDFCLQNTEKIKTILNKYRKEPLEGGWSPAAIFCNKCGKDTTKKIEYKGDYQVYYECECEHSETFDIRKKGIIKLKYRIDWPMRWHYEKVHFEPAGKDHYGAGGTRDSGIEIQKALWGDKPPHGFLYEWIGIKGGGQFSSSAGNVTTVDDVLEIYEPEIIRYLFAGTRPNASFDISFDLDVIKIYEDFDKCERIYYGKEEASDKEKEKNTLIYQLSQIDDDPNNIPKKMPLQISFRNIVNELNTKCMDETKVLKLYKDQIKDKNDEKRLKTRISCAKNWIEKYADDNFKFKVNKEKNKELFNSLDDTQKKALDMLKEAITSTDNAEEMESRIFNIPKELDMQMKDFFKLCYQVIISKDKGPKLAKFIIEIGKDEVAKLL